MHVKLRTWFPFLIQVYINGREMMKHAFDENGITYRMYDNFFSEISDIAMAQELADKFDSKSLCRQLDFLAHKVNPYLDTIENIFHQGYHWCVDQCEYATDVMFKSREALEDIYPSLVGHAFYDFKCTDVFSFLGRKPDNKFQGEAVSDYRKRPEGWRIKFRMKSNSIKMQKYPNGDPGTGKIPTTPCFPYYLTRLGECGTVGYSSLTAIFVCPSFNFFHMNNSLMSKSGKPGSLTPSKKTVDKNLEFYYYD